jgi:hypothetical protein
MAVERFWGPVDLVVNGVQAHNEALRRVAAEYSETRLVDVDRLMPRSGRYFDDVCHLTAEGSAKLAELLVAGATQ